MPIDSNDPRWGGYVPWFLRHKDFDGRGKFDVFFSRLSQRLERVVLFNEVGIPNLMHFGAWLESESLQRFRFNVSLALAGQIAFYFNPKVIQQEAETRGDSDTELANHIRRQIGGATEKELVRHVELATAKHYNELVVERLSVLECFLHIIPKDTAWFHDLIRDIKRFFAEAEIMLDINTIGQYPVILPMEEPLLQKEVLDELLPRLSSRLPQRASELINAYHSLLKGNSADSVFAEAFKTLEAIARDLTADGNFMFTKSYLDKYYEDLHPTIHNTLIQLAAHRGDKAGHGKDSPFPHEIRYLLFAICNAALLLLDYPRSG